MSYIFCINKSSLTILTFYNQETTRGSNFSYCQSINIVSFILGTPETNIYLFSLSGIHWIFQDILEKQLFYSIYTKPNNKIDSFLFTISTDHSLSVLTSNLKIFWINPND